MSVPPAATISWTSPTNIPLPDDDSQVNINIEQIIHAIFGDTHTPTVMLCLEDLGVEATADFNYLEENDLKDVIVYTVEDGNEPATRTAHRLKPIQVKKLMALKFWSLAQPTHTPDVWKTFDPASLAIYATRPAPINSLSPSNYPGTPLPHGSPMTAVTTTTLSSHQEFTKSIKRSVTDYPEFKDDRQFHDWNLTFTAMAATHGVETVLTPSYSPPDTEAATLSLIHI